LKEIDYMRALLYRGPNSVEVSEVPDPDLPDDRGAIVLVHAAGICGSDLHIYSGHGFSEDTGFCIGHEAVGEVVELGDSVTTLQLGARVLAPGSVGCSECGNCAHGLVSRCTNNDSWLKACYGLHSGLPGAQAELLAVPHAATNLVPIDDTISDSAAIFLTDNAPTAWYGARRARIQPGDTVAVIGLGPVGLMAVQSALLMGAARVLCVDLVADRLNRARSIGGEPVQGPDFRAGLRAATRGLGPDVVLEAVGSDETIDLALRAVRLGGRVSVVGVNQTKDFPFNMQMAQVKELEFSIGLCSVQYELKTLLPLASNGRFNFDSIVSHRMPLTEGSTAYRMFAAREDGVSKIILDPSE
jgi:threonine dehydrogenase-like Zn-dependent dehydrogenase